ncbi:MAG: dihydroorotase family protein [Candidatus Thorarchaeota archaeon]
MSEIVIRNGLIITETGRINADIRIIDEKIKEIGEELESISESALDINAEDLVIMPGGIDPHVHLSLPEYVTEEFRWSDNFESGSKAALAGGITTLGCISVPDKNETPIGTIERESKSINEQAIADFIIHPVIFTPTEETIHEIPKLMEKGCNTIKIFMVTDDYDDKEELYIKAIQAAKDNGMLSMIHCEDNEILRKTREKMVKEGKESLMYYADSRPVNSETLATQKAVDISNSTGAPIYIVHLSSEQALNICQEAQAENIPVYVESRPIFLYLTREKYLEPDGALYVVQPPLREKSDVEALWSGVKNGTISTIATDHAPHTREQKLNPELNISKLVPGINELQVMLPMLYSKGVVSGKITIERFIELTSTNVAKLFGLYPRKGTIRIGSDADLVLWDLEEERVIRDEDMFSQAGFSIYNGQSNKGWPKITIRRGQVVFEDGKITAKAGTGQIIPRKVTQKID